MCEYTSKSYSEYLKEKYSFITKDDLVIILGDSCDRGKDSIGLYIRYTEMIKDGYSIKHIMGNHEYMFLNHYLLRGSITMQWGK